MTEMKPIEMRLPCPECGELHIDEGEFATKLHHTHSCQHCGLTWRPAVAPTVGVRFLPGFRNEPQNAEQSILGSLVRRFSTEPDRAAGKTDAEVLAVTVGRLQDERDRARDEVARVGVEKASRIAELEAALSGMIETARPVTMHQSAAFTKAMKALAGVV